MTIAVERGVNIQINRQIKRTTKPCQRSEIPLIIENNKLYEKLLYCERFSYFIYCEKVSLFIGFRRQGTKIFIFSQGNVIRFKASSHISENLSKFTGDTPNDIISPGGSDGGEISPLNARVKRTWTHSQTFQQRRQVNQGGHSSP